MDACPAKPLDSNSTSMEIYNITAYFTNNRQPHSFRRHADVTVMFKTNDSKSVQAVVHITLIPKCFKNRNWNTVSHFWQIMRGTDGLWLTWNVLSSSRRIHENPQFSSTCTDCSSVFESVPHEKKYTVLHKKEGKAKEMNTTQEMNAGRRTNIGK
jgi:hypothetical protein